MKILSILPLLSLFLAASPAAHAAFRSVLRLDVTAVPTFTDNVASFLVGAQIHTSRDEARLLASRLFYLPENYESPDAPAICHWIIDDANERAPELHRVALVPVRDHGQRLIAQLKLYYANYKTKDGFFIFDTPAADGTGVPQLHLYNMGAYMLVSSSREAIVWASFNENQLLRRPPDSSGMPLLTVHPANLTACLNYSVFQKTETDPQQPLYWIGMLRLLQPFFDSTQGLWMTLALSRSGINIDMRAHMDTMTETGRMLTQWTTPAKETEALVPSRAAFALLSGMPASITNAPIFGTLGASVSDFAVYIAEVRTIGMYAVFTAELSNMEEVAGRNRLHADLATFNLFPGTRVVPAETRTARDGGEIHGFRLESSLRRGSTYSALMRAICEELVGECWTAGNRLFVSVALAPSAEVVKARNPTLRATLIDRVCRGVQKVPNRIRFAAVATPSSLLRSLLAATKVTASTHIRTTTSVSQESFAFAIAEERYGVLRFLLKINSSEFSTLRDVVIRGKPIVTQLMDDIEKRIPALEPPAQPEKPAGQDDAAPQPEDPAVPDAA